MTARKHDIMELIEFAEQPDGSYSVGPRLPGGCPNCGGDLMYWSDSSYGSYGNACLACKLFVWQNGSEIGTCALEMAFFPRCYRGIPALRAAVGWTGPTT